MPICLVTGAAHRLGRCLVNHLVARGFSPILHCHKSLSAAQSLQSDLQKKGVESWVYQQDFSDSARIESGFSEFLDKEKIIPDVLINSASTFAFDTCQSVDADGLRQHFETNLFSPVILSRVMVDRLNQQKSQGVKPLIINILDFKLANPAPDYFSYTLSKAGLKMATELMARELAASKVRVCAISPGYILPSPDQPQDDFMQLHHRTPLGHGPTPLDIAKAVEFLIESPSLTGVDISVDCGLRFHTRANDVAFEEKPA